MGVQTVTDGGVTELRLDWLDTRNAFGPDQERELRIPLEAATAADTSTQAMVISATGSCFSAGGNLKTLTEMIQSGGDGLKSIIYDEFHGVMRAIAASAAVVITAVDGPAIGFGCDLALASEMTFVGEKGRLAQGWIAAGQIPATGGVHYVRRRGGSQAVWRFLADQTLDGPGAQSLGLCLAVGDAREAALAMAHRFAGYRSPRWRPCDGWRGARPWKITCPPAGGTVEVVRRPPIFHAAPRRFWREAAADQGNNPSRLPAEPRSPLARSRNIPRGE